MWPNWNYKFVEQQGLNSGLYPKWTASQTWTIRPQDLFWYLPWGIYDHILDLTTFWSAFTTHLLHILPTLFTTLFTTLCNTFVRFSTMLFATLCYTFVVTLFTTLSNRTFLHFVHFLCALFVHFWCYLFTTLYYTFCTLFHYAFSLHFLLHFATTLCNNFLLCFATLLVRFFTTPFTILLVLYLFATLCTASGTGIHF